MERLNLKNVQELIVLGYVKTTAFETPRGLKHHVAYCAG
jgi:hypothetical protein